MRLAIVSPVSRERGIDPPCIHIDVVIDGEEPAGKRFPRFFSFYQPDGYPEEMAHDVIENLSGDSVVEEINGRQFAQKVEPFGRDGAVGKCDPYLMSQKCRCLQVPQRCVGDLDMMTCNTGIFFAPSASEATSPLR